MRSALVTVLVGVAGCGVVAQPAQAAALPSYTAVGIDSPQPQAGEGFGASLTTVGDIHGDGVNDVAVSGAVDVGGMSKVGRVWVLDGRTGAVLLTLDDPVPQAGARFGGGFAGIAGIGDVNGDGVPDVAVSASNQTVAGNTGQGKIWVFSGKDGHVLYSVDDPTPQRTRASRSGPTPGISTVTASATSLRSLRARTRAGCRAWGPRMRSAARTGTCSTRLSTPVARARRSATSERASATPVT